MVHYQKPRLDVGNYFLKWNEEKNHGIQQDEIRDVKRFLKDAIPLFDASYEILNNLQKSIHKNKYDWNKELFPRLCLMHRNKDNVVGYELHITTDGSTFLDRIEKIRAIDTNIKNNDIDLSTSETSTGRSQNVKKSMIYLKWNLGELLFNRQGNNPQKNG
jgi:hypothetical protein